MARGAAGSRPEITRGLLGRDRRSRHRGHEVVVSSVDELMTNGADLALDAHRANEWAFGLRRHEWILARLGYACS